MRRRVDLLRRELEAASGVQIRDDRLMVLGDEGDQVESAVTVHLDRNRMDAAGSLVDHVRLEGQWRVGGRTVFEAGELSAGSPPECGDRQVRLAVLVEIARPNVGHTGPSLECERRVR